jgi:hypothetical protein
MIDSVIERATINQMAVDELDQLLITIRARRVEKIKKLEKLAGVRADDAQLITFMLFEKALATAKKELKQLEAQDKKFDTALHKARVLAVECEAGGYVNG